MLTLTPSGLLQAATTYTLTIAGVQDTAGNGMASPVTVTFTTGSGAVLGGTTIVSYSPPNGAINVSDTVTVQIVFSQAMDVTSFDPNSTLELRATATQAIVPATITFSADQTTVMLKPNSPLSSGVNYTIMSPASYRLLNISGFALGQTVSSSFTAQ